MNRFILVVFFAIIPVSYCSALTQWGNGDLYSETTADLSYDSNLFLQENDSIDDFLSTFYGGLGYLMEERTVLNVEFELGLEVGRFLDYNTEDYEDWKSKFEISYPNHIESQGFFSFAAGWNQDTQSNADIGQRIEIETKDVDFQSTESISEKLQLEFSIGLVNEDYNNGIDPNDNLALNRSADLSDMGLLAAYQYSEKLSGTFAYQFNDLSYNDDLTEQQGDVFAVGLRGELSPKLTGSVSIGVRNSDLTGRGYRESQSR